MTEIKYHPSYYIAVYDYVEVSGDGKRKIIKTEEKEIKTWTADNRYLIDGNDFKIDFYLSAIMHVKKPWGYIKLAEEINRLFLTEFLCGFVREDNEKRHPECATPTHMGRSGSVGNISNCPFINIDIGDFTK